MRVIDGQSNGVARLSHLLSPLHLLSALRCGQSSDKTYNTYNTTCTLWILLPQSFWFYPAVLANIWLIYAAYFGSNSKMLFLPGLSHWHALYLAPLTLTPRRGPGPCQRIRKFVQNNTHHISLTPCVQNLRKIPITSQLGDLLVSFVKMFRRCILECMVN